MSEALEVRRAEPEELETVVGILSECARWLLGRGIRQWHDPFPAERVAALLETGAFYLARLDGCSAGARRARHRPLDRLGGGAGRGRQAGLPAADCLSENAALRAYYEGLGFASRGEVEIEDFRATLFERPCRFDAC